MWLWLGPGKKITKHGVSINGRTLIGISMYITVRYSHKPKVKEESGLLSSSSGSGNIFGKKQLLPTNYTLTSIQCLTFHKILTLCCYNFHITTSTTSFYCLFSYFFFLPKSNHQMYHITTFLLQNQTKMSNKAERLNNNIWWPTLLIN